MRALIAAVALITLTGCASGQVPLVGALVGGSPFGDISTLAIDDITAALADATAHGDKAAMQCYPVLLEVIKNLPAQAPAAPKGIVSAFQSARDVAKSIQSQAAAGQGSLVQTVNLGCAALFNDAHGDILRLGAIFRP